MKWWQVIAVILILVCIAILATHVRAAEPWQMLGDVQGDGLVTREDGLILQWLLEGRTFPANWTERICSNVICGDIDGDGMLTDVDATAVLDYAAHRPTLPGIGGACYWLRDVVPPAMCRTYAGE